MTTVKLPETDLARITKYCADRVLSGTAAALLAEIDEDPTCVFWG